MPVAEPVAATPVEEPVAPVAAPVEPAVEPTVEVAAAPEQPPMDVAVVNCDEKGVQETGSSLTPSIINMMNTIVGAGTISLPSSFLISGLGGGAILMVISVILSLYGAHYLSAASIYAKDGAYGGVGSKVVNRAVGMAADIFMIVFDFGIAIGYSNIVFAQTVEVASNWTGIPLADVEKWKPVSI